VTAWKKAKERLDSKQNDLRRAESDRERLIGRDIPEAKAAEEEAWAKVLALREGTS
jgi:hypothetical protein